MLSFCHYGYLLKDFILAVLDHGCLALLLGSTAACHGRNMCHCKTPQPKDSKGEGKKEEGTVVPLWPSKACPQRAADLLLDPHFFRLPPTSYSTPRGTVTSITPENTWKWSRVSGKLMSLGKGKCLLRKWRCSSNLHSLPSLVTHSSLCRMLYILHKYQHSSGSTFPNLLLLSLQNPKRHIQQEVFIPT